jgi:hypothetical protein
VAGSIVNNLFSTVERSIGPIAAGPAGQCTVGAAACGTVEPPKSYEPDETVLNEIYEKELLVGLLRVAGGTS